MSPSGLKKTLKRLLQIIMHEVSIMEQTLEIALNHAKQQGQLKFIGLK